MSNLEKNKDIKPSSDDVVEINNALQKSDKFISNIIVSVDEVEETSNKIDELVSLASQIKEKKVSRFFGNKDVIESLQSIADFQADIMNELWGYQQKMFDQFKNLADNSNNLIMLGVANAAVTRALIQQLRTKTSQSLSEEARNQLFNVIRDLERQADAQDRISRLREKVDSLSSTLSQALNDEICCRKNDTTLLNNSIQQSYTSLMNEIEDMQNKFELENSQINHYLDSSFKKYAERLDSQASMINEIVEVSKKDKDTIRQRMLEDKAEHSKAILDLQCEVKYLKSQNIKLRTLEYVAIFLGLLAIILQFVL